MLVGSRAQVWHGTAFKTSGGLTKSNLLQNKSGRVVSRSKHTASKKEKRLLKHGYGTKKGHFGAVKMGTKSKKMRGGSPYGSNFSPSSFDGTDGQGITNYGAGSNSVQFAAGMAGGKRGKSRKMRGGAPYGNSYSPASFDGIDGQGVTNFGAGSNNVQFAAGMAGGKRGKSRKMRGGKGYGWLSGSGIDGQGVTNFGAGSNDVQFAAGMAGGRRRRSKRGGTTEPVPVGMGNPLNAALDAS